MIKHIVVVSASSAIAHSCARIWAKKGARFSLVGRNKDKLAATLADLEAQSGNTTGQIFVNDLVTPAAIDQCCNQIAKLGRIDIVLIAQGYMPDQAQAQNDLALLQHSILVNATSVVMFAEAFTRIFELENQGTLAIISSVSGDRGRKRNYIYGASKGLLNRYTQGMMHRLAKTNIKIILIKPGPTATPMTANYSELGIRVAPLELVAKQIVNGINKGKTIIYTPKKWRIIMFIVQHLPRVIFHKLRV